MFDISTVCFYRCGTPGLLNFEQWSVHALYSDWIRSRVLTQTKGKHEVAWVKPIPLQREMIPVS